MFMADTWLKSADTPPSWLVMVASAKVRNIRVTGGGGHTLEASPAVMNQGVGAPWSWEGWRMRFRKPKQDPGFSLCPVEVVQVVVQTPGVQRGQGAMIPVVTATGL